jgi:hypothetical protein
MKPTDEATNHDERPHSPLKHIRPLLCLCGFLRPTNRRPRRRPRSLSLDLILNLTQSLRSLPSSLSHSHLHRLDDLRSRGRYVLHRLRDGSNDRCDCLLEGYFGENFRRCSGSLCRE